ncbi:MAG: hypothetical protein JNG88_13940 [Phycisphaerales bacterium]|nr:hypothetical protein [Phycisphaerales bacterium]
MTRFEKLRQAVSGRWQSPLALAAVFAFAATLYNLIPPSRSLDFDSLLADIRVMIDRGAYVDAADSCANLLEVSPPVSIEQQGTLHELLAEIIYVQQEPLKRRSVSNLSKVIEHQAQADALGLQRSAPAGMRLAKTHEWLRNQPAALDAYRRVATDSAESGQNRDAMQAIVRLLEGVDGAAEERNYWLDRLLEDDSIRPEYAAWALHSRVSDTLAAGDVVGAANLLDQYGGRVRSSDLRGYYEYLAALIAVAVGRDEQAQASVAWIDEWLKSNTRSENRSESIGHLPTLNEVLRGQLALRAGAKEEALTAFERGLVVMGADQIVRESDSSVFVDAAIGRGLTLGLLGRSDEALVALLSTLEKSERYFSNPLPTVARVRRTLAELFEFAYAAKDYDAALAYLDRAAALFPHASPANAQQQNVQQADMLETLGTVSAEAASTGKTVSVDRRRRDSGVYYESAAARVVTDETRYANLLWSAAEQFDLAGLRADSRRALLKFLDGRSFDTRTSKALLKLGELAQADGDLLAAMDWYRQVAERFPKLDDAGQARLRAAECATALGGDHLVVAERLLSGLLTDDAISPVARVYRDALLALADFDYDQERFSESISRLEAFLSLYPTDDELWRARFQLADAYRRSGLAMRDAMKDRAIGDQQEWRERLRTAAARYDDFLNSLPTDPQHPARDYERLSLFFRGDCMFELNEPASLQEALATYRQIASRAEGDPDALTAQVQIANIYLRMGRATEAARAIERARWLLRSISDQAIAASGFGQSRREWDQYLAAIAASPLFRDVLTASR